MKKIKVLLSRLFDRVFLRFIIVGIINTCFGTAIMFLLYNCLLHPYKWGYWVSSAANYFFGSILSYFLNKHFTFRNTEKGFRPILRFALNISLCYLIAYGAAKPLASWLLSGFGSTVRDNCAMVIGMGFFVMLNYIGQRFFAFRK